MRCELLNERKFLIGLLVCLTAVLGCNSKPNPAATAYTKGLNCLTSATDQDPYTAIACFDEAIKLEPGNSKARFQRGVVYLMIDNYDNALADFQEAIALDKEPSAEMFEKSGEAYLGQKKFAEAVASFSQSICIDEQNAQAFYKRSIAQAKLGEKGKSAADYHRACKLQHEFSQQTDPSIAYNKETPEAAPTPAPSSAIIASAPENKEVNEFYREGLLKFAAADYEKAIDCFTKALQKQPRLAEAYCKRAEAYAALGEYEKSVADYSLAINYDRKAINAYLGRAAAYEKQDDFYLAAMNFGEAIKLEPNDPAHYLQRGNAYFDCQEYRTALVDYSRVLQMGAVDTGILCKRGLTYEKLGDFDTAIADYSAAILRDPHSAAARRQRARAYLREWKKTSQAKPEVIAETEATASARAVQLLADACTDLDKTIELDPRNSDAYLDRVTANAALGNLQKAIADLDKVLELKPHDAEANWRKGDIYLFDKNFEAAMKCFNAAIKQDSDCAEACYGRGVVNLADHFLPDAINDFTTAIRINPEFASAYRGRGDAYLALSNVTQAIANYSDAIRLDDKNAAAFCQRARCYYLDHQYYKALADCDDAIRRKENYVAAYNIRGCTYLALNDYDRAIVELNAAIHYDSRDAKVLNNLGVAYAGKKDLPAAIINYDAALAIQDQDSTCLHNRGLAYLKSVERNPGFRLTALPTPESGGVSNTLDRQNLQKAIADLARASEKSQDPNIHYDLATAYYMKHDYQSAKKEFGEAIRLNPNFAKAYYYRSLSAKNLHDDAKAEADMKKWNELKAIPADRLAK